jgi:hypothetical protein
MQMATQPWGCGRPGSLLPRHHPRREVWAALRTTPFLTPCSLLLFPSPQPHQAIATTLFQAFSMFRIISHPATSTLACISLASIAVAARSTSQEESNIALASDTHYRHRALPIAISPSTHQPPSASPNKSSSSSSNPKPSFWRYYFPSDASHFHPHLSSSHPIPIPAGLLSYPSLKKGLPQRMRDEIKLQSLMERAVKSAASQDRVEMGKVAEAISTIAYGKGLKADDRRIFLEQYGCAKFSPEATRPHGGVIQCTFFLNNLITTRLWSPILHP